MGLRDRLGTVRDYILASFVPVSDHPARGGMTGEQTSETTDESADSDDE